jgi:UBX domain-containing protein 7
MDGEIEAQFLGITGSTPEKAEQYLRLTDFNLEQAIQLFFDSGGVDLEGHGRSPAPQRQVQPPPRPQQSRPSQGYADVDGVIHVDSDEEMEDDDEPEITGWQQRTQPAAGTSTTAGQRTSANATPPLVHGGSGRHSLEESDEAMARRLQEELYAGGDMAGNFDNDGVRAPIAKVRETLVGGPEWGSSDPTMGEAIMAQLRGRTPQGASSRGKPTVTCSATLLLDHSNGPSSWNLQPTARFNEYLGRGRGSFFSASSPFTYHRWRFRDIFQSIFAG